MLTVGRSLGRGEWKLMYDILTIRKLKNAERVFAFWVSRSAYQRAYRVCSIVAGEGVLLSDKKTGQGMVGVENRQLAVERFRYLIVAADRIHYGKHFTMPFSGL